MIVRRLVLFALAALGVAWSMADRAAAQSYPDRLIKMVVPYPGRRADRPHRAAGGAAPRADPGADRDHRESRRRRRRARHQGGRRRRARRLHAAVRQCERAGGGAGGLSLPRLRHRQAFHAYCESDRRLRGARGGAGFPAPERPGAHRLCQGQSRQAQFRLHGLRQSHASGGGAVQAADRNRLRPCPLQGFAGSGRRHRRRPGAHSVRGSCGAAAAGARGQDPRARGLERRRAMRLRRSCRR